MSLLLFFLAVGWNCFQMGLGRKVDPEPGRCRRTDGKKWRCSKEAYPPDSKYCERHMHRGKNRSRKPVEVGNIQQWQTLQVQQQQPRTSHHQSPRLTLLFLPFFLPCPCPLSPNSITTINFATTVTFPGPSSLYVSPCIEASRVGLSPQENTAHSLLDSGSYSQTNTDYRNSYVYRLKEEVGEHAFFSEPSGAMRSFSGSSVDDSWQLAPLTMSSSSSKQESCSGLQSEYSYLQLQSLTDHSTKQSKQEDDEHCYIKFGMPNELDKGEPQRQYTVSLMNGHQNIGIPGSIWMINLQTAHQFQQPGSQYPSLRPHMTFPFSIQELITMVEYPVVGSGSGSGSDKESKALQTGLKVGAALLT
ncbi:hypothetical protein GQ457_07G045730 [Hibiscus cannabinus]